MEATAKAISAEVQKLAGSTQERVQEEDEHGIQESFEQLCVAAKQKSPRQKAPRPEPVRQDRTQYGFEACIDCSKVSKIILNNRLHLETGEVVPLELIPIGDGKFKNVNTQEVFDEPAHAARIHCKQMAYLTFRGRAFHTLDQQSKGIKTPHGKSYRNYDWQEYWEYVDLDGLNHPIEDIKRKKPIIPRPRGAKKSAV